MSFCVWRCISHGSVNPEHLPWGFYQCKYKTGSGTNNNIISSVECCQVFKGCKVDSWCNKMLDKSSCKLKEYLYLTTSGHFGEYLYAHLLKISTGNRSQRPFCPVVFKLFFLRNKILWSYSLILKVRKLSIR